MRGAPVCDSLVRERLSEDEDMRSKTMEADFLLSEPPEATYYVGGGGHRWDAG